MKTTYLLSFVFLAVLWTGCVTQEEKIMPNQSALSPGQYSRVFEKTITKTVGCDYLLFQPDGYGLKDQRWPMILFLHGAGQRGSDLQKVKKHGPPGIVETKKDFPFILVSPQCPEEQWWSNDVLTNLLDEVIAKYAVDTDRVYLTGLSMGGFGTWKLACEYPDRFAAIAPVCGGGEPPLARKLKEVPVWAFHGAKDKAIPLNKSVEMVDAVNASGGNARLTVYTDAEHDSWTVTYNNQELYNWFLQHRKSDRTK